MNGGDEPGIPCHRQEAEGRALQTSQNELRKGRGAEGERKGTTREGALEMEGEESFHQKEVVRSGVCCKD